MNAPAGIIKSSHDVLTAYHEAGHALMATLCGERIVRVEIDGDDEHAGSCAAMRLLPPPDHENDAGMPTVHDERRLLCLCAGMVAESLVSGHEGWDESSHDLDHAVRIALRVVGRCERVVPYLEATWEHTRDLLTRHWRAVEVVAARLLIDRSLPGLEVRQILVPLLLA